MNGRVRIAIAVIVALALLALVAAPAGAQGPSQWVGVWVSNDPAPPDGDGSLNRLSITPAGGSNFNLIWRETYFSVCDGAPGVGLGTAPVPEDDTLVASMVFYCMGVPTLSVDVEFEYDPGTGTMRTEVNGEDVIWSRVGGPPTF